MSSAFGSKRNCGKKLVDRVLLAHQDLFFRTVGSCLWFVLGVSLGIGQELARPKVLEDGWTIQLVASEPDLVTPISCRFDHAGRLLVVESHTHFPPAEYPGPKVDRIYIFDQMTDGQAEGSLQARKRLFYEGGTATMGIAVLPDGWLAVASRSEVIRIRDSDGDDVADQTEVLLRMETKATYPHNGLAGLALGPDGLLYVGQGENLGDPYQLVGTDGSKQIGDGEGGNIFRCTLDGKQVERVATGFWNPFGIYFDPAGRLWTVENDPDARPPCRLLHVASTGDYGFQFRFGRAGTHPLLSWYGEYPGTLGMVSGTGEAPCATLAYDGALWVTSWGSNRLERYQLSPKGASWQAKMDVIVQGDANFRPVDMAVGPDGSLFFTDWVDRSYPVHRQGKLWRLCKKDRESLRTDWPPLSEQETRAQQLASSPAKDREELLDALESTDAFVRQSAVAGLCKERMATQLTWQAANSPQKKMGLLVALRWLELADPDSLTADARSKWITLGLDDDAIDVKRAALRWATERKEQGQLPQIRDLLQEKGLTSDLFAGVIGSIAYLESGGAARGARDPVREALLYQFASDPQQADHLRALAVRMLPAECEKPSDEELSSWILETSDRAFGGEIVRMLAARGTKSALDRLAAVAAHEDSPMQIRADALAGLAKNAGEYSAVINKLALPRAPKVLRTEAQRVLRRGWSAPGDSRPQRHDIAGWGKLIGETGDVEAGRRVFFRTTCANCHAHTERGSRVGPDLTKLAGEMTRERLLESILTPSREVGPLFVPWRVLTTDGRILTGMRLEQSGAGDKMHFLGAEGGNFQVSLTDIESLEPSKQSIMPDGLEETMSLDELADLIAFLLAPVD